MDVSDEPGGGSVALTPGETILPTEAATSAVAAPPETSPDTSTAPGELDWGPNHNDGSLRLTVSADCVTRGTPVTVMVHGPERAGIGLIAAYSDDQAHGAMTVGETDGEGAFLWRFVVAPTAPEGPARVLAAVSGEQWKGEAASGDVPFRVVRDRSEC